MAWRHKIQTFFVDRNLIDKCIIILLWLYLPPSYFTTFFVYFTTSFVFLTVTIVAYPGHPSPVEEEKSVNMAFGTLLKLNLYWSHFLGITCKLIHSFFISWNFLSELAELDQKSHNTRTRKLPYSFCCVLCAVCYSRSLYLRNYSSTVTVPLKHESSSTIAKVPF